MSLARSRPSANEALPTQIINVSFDETLCPLYTHSIAQITAETEIITRSITLEGNLGSLNLEGNLGAATLD
jgi:hypothetical protein